MSKPFSISMMSYVKNPKTGKRDVPNGYKHGEFDTAEELAAWRDKYKKLPEDKHDDDGGKDGK